MSEETEAERLETEACARSAVQPVVRWRYLVAVYWPNDRAYGKSTEYDTEAEALNHRARLKAKPYGYEDVHVWRQAYLHEMIAT